MIFTVMGLPADHLKVVEKIDALGIQLRYQTQSRPRRWTGLLRRSTFARAIQGSNSIEGYNVTYEDAVAAVENQEPMDAASEAWAAVVGYRAAMGYILQLADDPYFKFNEGTVRSLHYIMIGYDLTKYPGRWRPGHVYVRNQPTGQIVYDGPAVDMVLELMSELIDALNAPDRLPAVVRAAMAHLNLVMIHPFSDGNGRMARALQTMVLSREGILDPRFSSIEEYLGRNTLAYYAVLAEVGQGSWHPEKDPLPWIRFCLTAHYRQAETLLRRTKEMARAWDYLEAEVKRRGLPERATLALVDATFGWRVRNSTYRAAAEVSENLASRDLKLLVDQGLLMPRGERRGRSYVASDFLREIRAKTRERKVVTEPFTETSVVTEAPAQAYLPGLGSE
ncbi:MAG: Fic family protein [Pseudomonadota bacterium]